MLHVVDKMWENCNLSDKSGTGLVPAYVAELQR